jgi:hypothetical protein
MGGRHRLEAHSINGPEVIGPPAGWAEDGQVDIIGEDGFYQTREFCGETRNGFVKMAHRAVPPSEPLLLRHGAGLGIGWRTLASAAYRGDDVTVYRSAGEAAIKV